MEIPLGYIKSYLEQLDNGETIERSLEKIEKERDDIVAEYRNLIKTDEDKKTFDDTYNNIRSIYRYAEDHLFWVEHWFHTIWYAKVRQLGQLLVNDGWLDEVDDSSCSTATRFRNCLPSYQPAGIGCDIPVRSERYKATVAKRKKFSRRPNSGTPASIGCSPRGGG
jgi:pyruvate,water dikinase